MRGAGRVRSMRARRRASQRGLCQNDRYHGTEDGLPPRLVKIMTNDVVLVVGAGPVGLMMAAELARYGVRVRVIDKAATRTDKSKAIVVWSRSLELMDRMGCAAAFIAAGRQVHATNLLAGGKRVAHVRFDAVQTPYPYALLLPQSDTERLLEEHLNSYGVRVERELELTRFSAEEDRVHIGLQDAHGREESSDVTWLIGCDGAHSTVRHGLGMQFEGETLPSQWILADLKLAGVKTAADELDIYFHADGVLLTFPISPGRFRLIADVGGAERADPTLAEVQALIDRRGPGGVRAFEPSWLAGFTINERKVSNYRAGRVFLAGDAAHVHSPAGGQGMNTGMQDAINLAWKVALVVHGHAPQAMLDSYSVERSEVARQVLADSGRLTAMGTLKGGFTQALRNELVSLVLGLPAAQRVMTNKLTELSIEYRDSPLTRSARGAPDGPRAGTRAPLPSGAPVGAGRVPRFAIFAEPGAESAALLTRHRDLLEPELRAPFGTDGIWLVRPDGYVALSARHGAWPDVADYLDELGGGAS